MRKAVYPGSFDPITLGHVDIIKRMSNVFDEVTVLITHSPNKTGLFTPLERKSLIEKCKLPKVKVDIWNGLTVDYLKKHNSHVIVRGLRAVVDFEYELTMANMNKKLDPQIETLLVFASPEYYFVSSRGVKEIATYGGVLNGLVPPHVQKVLSKKLKKK